MWYLYGVALLAGVASAVEPGQNASLAKGSGDPLFAGLVCCCVGVAVFGILLAVNGRLAWPGSGDAPWWGWLGGIMGAVVVVAQLYVSQRIGAAPFLGLVVTAGVATSIVLDHFGLVGFAQHTASPWRVLGAALMVAGVTLVAIF